MEASSVGHCGMFQMSAPALTSCLWDHTSAADSGPVAGSITFHGAMQESAWEEEKPQNRVGLLSLLMLFFSFFLFLKLINAIELLCVGFGKQKRNHPSPCYPYVISDIIGVSSYFF